MEWALVVTAHPARAKLWISGELELARLHTVKRARLLLHVPRSSSGSCTGDIMLGGEGSCSITSSVERALAQMKRRDHYFGHLGHTRGDQRNIDAKY
jgi:hypothetical protein